MDSHYLQRQRFQLQKRVRRLNSCGWQLFHSSFVQFWNYLQSNALLSGVLSRMAAEAPLHQEGIVAITTQRHVPIFSFEQEAAGFVFRVVEYCAKQPVDGTLGPEAKIGRALAQVSKHDEALDSFREHYLEPFYELLDEALDQQGAVLSLLIKYKRKVEWFEREQLAAVATKGERALVQHLYAYLFDQGMDFHIEPQSVSGNADLIAKDLVLDAKVFDGDPSSRGTRNIKHGVNQVLTYTRDFNQAVGYLVVYRTCPEDLQFGFANSTTLVPFVGLGGKTLYILVVDICDYGTSASKRGALKAHLLEEADLREYIPDSASPTP